MSMPLPAMRALAASLLVACCATVSADEGDPPEVTYPALPARGATPEAFAPAGWAIEMRAAGDLDKDGRDDLVLVLRMHDPANVIHNDGPGPDEFDTNPRMLAVLFADAGGYRLAAEDHALVPRPDNPVMDDYLGGDGAVSVQRGGFSVGLHAWASAGTWYTSGTTFTFRWQEGCFRLIGYDRIEAHRASGDTTTISANYPARRATVEIGNLAEDGPSKTRTLRLPARPMPCLADIGNGFDFDPGVPTE